MDRADFHSWMQISESVSDKRDFFHLWLRQGSSGDWKTVEEELRSYLERAHQDARTVFHRGLMLDLDPLTPSGHQYPNSLPLDAKKGLFGEAFCGMMAEAFECAGKDCWMIPCFLFRLHDDAFNYLFRLMFGAEVSKAAPGRKGSDFIALELDADGHVVSFLNGESKCHETFNITKAREALAKMKQDSKLPVSLPQLVVIMCETNAERFASTIESIRRILLSRNQPKVPMAEMFVAVYAKPGIKECSEPRLNYQDKLGSHDCDRPLQIVEVWIPDAEQMIEELYNSLYVPAAEANV